MVYSSAMSEEIEAKHLMVPRVLWGAMLFAQLIFPVVAFIAAPELEDPDRLTAWILAGIGAATALLAPTITSMVLRSTLGQRHAKRTAAEIMARAFTPFVLNLALRESGAIMGFVVFFLTRDWMLWAIPAGLAFVMTAGAFPTAESLRRLQEP